MRNGHGFLNGCACPACEQPELWDEVRELTAGVWPDRESDLGDYWEPNIWIIHPAPTG